MTEDKDERKGFSGLSQLTTDPDGVTFSKEANTAEKPSENRGSENSGEVNEPVSPQRREKGPSGKGVPTENQGVSAGKQFFWSIVIISGIITVALSQDPGTPSDAGSENYSDITDSSTAGVSGNASDGAIGASESSQNGYQDSSNLDYQSEDDPGSSQDLSFNKPPEGVDRVLSMPELRWCIGTGIQIDTMRGMFDTNTGIDNFNRIVDDYNKRCERFRYREGALSRAEAQVEARRGAVEGQARAWAFELKGEHSSRGSDAASENQLTKNVQSLLNRLGYKAGPTDGIYGSKTEAAIKQFQDDYSLVEDGEVSPQLLESLRFAVANSDTGDSYRNDPSNRYASGNSKDFDKPVIDPPRSGQVRTYTDKNRVAPLEIETEGGSNYLVRLRDAQTDKKVIDIFVRGGSTETVDIPLGTYEIKYASGNKWYGIDHLFGPSSNYQKADSEFSFQREGNSISGYTLSLYKVQGGNLRTSSIGPEEF